METTKWILDATHSELGFRIRHLMITNVTGTFRSFEAEVETEGDDFGSAQVQLKADMSTISTNNEQRDAHLRNSDFFEVETYPELHFRSSHVAKSDPDTLLIDGELTLKGVSKPVQLKAEMGGITRDPWGNVRAGFVVTAKINRSEWGIAFNAALETGGLVLGEEVRLHAEVQFVKQAVAVEA